MLLETVKVFHPNRDGSAMVINAKDFNKSIHKIYDDKDQPVEDDKDVVDVAVEETPSVQKQEPEKKRPGRKPLWR